MLALHFFLSSVAVVVAAVCLLQKEIRMRIRAASCAGRNWHDGRPASGPCKSFARLYNKLLRISCEKCGNSGTHTADALPCSALRCPVSSLILRHKTEACSQFPVSKRPTSPKPETARTMSRLWIFSFVFGICICIRIGIGASEPHLNYG